MGNSCGGGATTAIGGDPKALILRRARRAVSKDEAVTQGATICILRCADGSYYTGIRARRRSRLLVAPGIGTSRPSRLLTRGCNRAIPTRRKWIFDHDKTRRRADGRPIGGA